jgi:V8-like Glu-specific endopeptidase
MRRLLPILALLATPAPAAELTALLTDDQIGPWKGVGRLVIAERASCSGALVRDRIVLTAAHCLFDRTSRRLAAPEDVAFYAGLRNGRFAAKGVGRRIVVHPEYRYEDELSERGRYGVDIAIVEMAEPVAGNGVRPFELSTAFFKGDPVTIVSYAKGRNEYPSLERGCRTELRTRQDAEFACHVDFGASGAPVFRDGPGGPRIVSVLSGLLDRGDDRLALGAVLGHTLPLLLEELQRTSPGRKQATPSDRRTVPGFSKPPDK